MAGRMLSATPEAGGGTAVDGAANDPHATSDNPGLRLLDALRAGNDRAALEVCGPATRVVAENMGWSGEGRDDIGLMLIVARERFPGLTFESRTRQVGFGLVIEEARVRDVQPEAPSETPGADVVQPAGPSDHPMYDAMLDAGAGSRAVVLWHGLGGDEPPTPLDMPVRVTVRHDDLRVYEVSFSFPAALLRRALGERVDPFELSLSEVQSAFVAPAGTELTTRVIAPRGTASTASAPEAAHRRDAVVGDRRPRRRRWRLPVVLLVAAVLAAGSWWVMAH